MAKSNAERQAALRSRLRSMPLLERHGFREPPEVAKERLAVEKDLAKVTARADALNQRIAEILKGEPDTDAKFLALAELTRFRRLNFPIT